MSLINDVLKDLDRRPGPQGNGPLPPLGENRGGKLAKDLWPAALAVLLVIGVGLAAWRGWEGQPARSQGTAAGPNPNLIVAPASPGVSAGAGPARPARATAPQLARPAAAAPPMQPHAAPKALVEAPRPPKAALTQRRKPMGETHRAVAQAPHSMPERPAPILPVSSPRGRALADYDAALGIEGLDHRTAEARLRAALAMDPGLTAAWLQLARLLWDDGRHGEALSSLREALDHNPQNGPLNLLYARLLATAGRPAEGLQRLLTLRPAPTGNPDYYGLVGTLAQQTGNYPLAEAAFGNAMLLQSDNPRWRLGLGLALAAQGKPQARPYLEAALAATPADGPLADYLRKVLAGMGGPHR